MDTLINKSVVMLGKSRALSADEYSKQLETHSITCKSKMDEDIVAVVEGRMLNPLEQDRLEAIYLEKKVPIINIDTLEEWLCSHIHTKKLLMSLKLSRDSDRLFGFLTNPLIEDELFLKLFSMYDFKGESFFENDENRDVTAALIGRFYPNVTKDHNVVYSSMGMVQLIQSTSNALLIETISNLAMIQERLKEEYVEGSVNTILQALCIHNALPLAIQKKYARSLHVELKLLLCMRENIDSEVEKLLLNSNEEVVLEQLSCQKRLSKETREVLMQNYSHNILSSHTLDEELFTAFSQLDVLALSSNPSLTCKMQAILLTQFDCAKTLASNSAICDDTISTLLEKNKSDINVALACNSAVNRAILEEMIQESSLHVALASNSSISKTMIEKLSLSSDIKVLENLAQNSSTPLDTLNLFMLDFRLEHLVRKNPVIQENFRR